MLLDDGRGLFDQVFLGRGAVMVVLIFGTYVAMTVAIYIGIWAFDGREIWMNVFR